MTSAFPTSEQAWDDQRSTITRLYLDENRQLEDVMDIMKRDHQFKATKKMYKSRITKWQIDKRNKKGDMVPIMRKYHQRGQVGKPSAFQLRGRQVNLGSMIRFMERERLTIEDVVSSTVATPPSLQVYTPAQSPRLTHQSTEYTAAASPEPSKDSDANIQSHPADANALYQCDSTAGASDMALVHDPILEQLQRALTPLSIWTADHEPLEILLSAIRTYFNGSLEAGTWINIGRDTPLYSTKDLGGVGHRATTQMWKMIVTGFATLSSSNDALDIQTAELLLVSAGDRFLSAINKEPEGLVRRILIIAALLKLFPTCRTAFRKLYEFFAAISKVVLRNDSHPIAVIIAYLLRLDGLGQLADAANAGAHEISEIYTEKLGALHLCSVKSETDWRTAFRTAEGNGPCADLVKSATQLRAQSGATDSRVMYTTYTLTVSYFRIQRYDSAQWEAQRILRAFPLKSIHAYSAGTISFLQSCAASVSYMLEHRQDWQAAISYQELAIEILEERDSKNPELLPNLMHLEGLALQSGNPVLYDRARQKRLHFLEQIKPDLL